MQSVAARRRAFASGLRNASLASELTGTILGRSSMSARTRPRMAVLSSLLLLGSVWPGPAAEDNFTKPPQEIENSIGMKLVLIPRGKFKMGSPGDEKGRNND